MKIVCDACQAKYSISDDKVQGKVFKIRCKKCSNIIVVRGGAGAVEAPAQPAVEKETRVYDYGYEGGEAPAGDDAVWHVVINQDQVGPMTAAEVHQRFGTGEIDAETYIWREGFADWLPIAQVDTFAALAAGGGAAPSGAGHDAVSSMFGGAGGEEAGTTRSDPGDLFAASSAGARGGAGAGDDDDGGDLFGGGRSAPAAQAASSAQAANAKMRGERNENSVLFSLNNLAQLASDKPPPASASSGGGGGSVPGHAGGEGSGLIDIRSMASAYLGGGGAGVASKPMAASSIGSIDDLPVFSGVGFSEPAVIVPTGRPSGNNKLMYGLIAGVGGLALVAIVLIVVLLRGGGNKGNTPTAATGSSAAVAAAGSSAEAAPGSAAGSSAATDTGSAAGASGSAAVVATGSGSGSGSATQVAVADTKPPTPDKPAAPDKTPTPPASHPTAAIKKPAEKTTPRETPQPKHTDPKPDKTPPVVADKKPPPDTGGCDEVSCVLNNYDGACCAKFKKGGSKPGGSSSPGASKPSGGGDLPDGLDRSMISDGVAKVKGKVMSCGDKSPAKGQVKVSVKVGADGKVVSVSVKATPDPALGGCVAAAMQHATFAKTQNGGSFGYPFVF